MARPATRYCWAVQYWSKRLGWWTVTSSIRNTRRGAINWYRHLYTTRGDLHWRRERDAGRVRCIQVRVIAFEGKDA